MKKFLSASLNLLVLCSVFSVQAEEVVPQASDMEDNTGAFMQLGLSFNSGKMTLGQPKASPAYLTTMPTYKIDDNNTLTGGSAINPKLSAKGLNVRTSFGYNYSITPLFSTGLEFQVAMGGTKGKLAYPCVLTTNTPDSESAPIDTAHDQLLNVRHKTQLSGSAFLELNVGRFAPYVEAGWSATTTRVGTNKKSLVEYKAKSAFHHGYVLGMGFSIKMTNLDSVCFSFQMHKYQTKNIRIFTSKDETQGTMVDIKPRICSFSVSYSFLLPENQGFNMN